VTGNAQPEDIATFIFSGGVDQMLTKPLKKATLMDALHHCVTHNNLTRHKVHLKALH
jgi:hypothetical protein